MVWRENLGRIDKLYKDNFLDLYKDIRNHSFDLMFIFALAIFSNFFW